MADWKVPATVNAKVLGNFFELCVDSESRELDDKAEMEIAFLAVSAENNALI